MPTPSVHRRELSGRIGLDPSAMLSLMQVQHHNPPHCPTNGPGATISPQEARWLRQFQWPQTRREKVKNWFRALPSLNHSRKEQE